MYIDLQFAYAGSICVPGKTLAPPAITLSGKICTGSWLQLTVGSLGSVHGLGMYVNTQAQPSIALRSMKDFVLR